jgi:hypothetical protein
MTNAVQPQDDVVRKLIAREAQEIEMCLVMSSKGRRRVAVSV